MELGEVCDVILRRDAGQLLIDRLEDWRREQGLRRQRR